MNELKHFGVKGMRWGIRRDRGSNNITVGSGLGSGRRALKKAAFDGNTAARESLAKSRASSDGSKLGSGRKAIKEANAARKAAAKESLANSKAAAKAKKPTNDDILNARKDLDGVRKEYMDARKKYMDTNERSKKFDAVQKSYRELERKYMNTLDISKLSTGREKASKVIGTIGATSASVAVLTYLASK